MGPLQTTWFPDLGDYDDRAPELDEVADWARIVAKLWPDGDNCEHLEAGA
jgi:hypothetical protein